MTGMANHARKGTVPRRAMFSAWAVFLSMACTTMTFQVFHAIQYGRMPWWLAVLYGVVPLGISIGVLDFVAEWEDAPGWASWAAYAITAGAMFLSATATGSVVLHAAPGHLSGLFGLLLDAAALLSIRFILTAPRAARKRAAAEASEVERLARKLAEVTASAHAQITGLRDSASALEAGNAEAVARAQAEAARAARAEAAAQAEAAQRASAVRDLEDLTARHDEAVGELEAARQRAGKAEDRARKLAAAADRGKAGSGTRKAATGTRRSAGSATGSEAPTAGAEDLVPPPGLTTEELVQWWVGKGKSPSQAGILADVSDSRGRQIMREVNKRSFRVLDGEEQTG